MIAHRKQIIESENQTNQNKVVLKSPSFLDDLRGTRALHSNSSQAPPLIENKSYTHVDAIESYRTVIHYHASFIFIMIIVYSICMSGIENISRLITILSFIISLIYSIISGAYILKLLSSWNSAIKNGLIKFWNICTKFSIKNYRLLREYREVYQYHYKDILSKIPNMNDPKKAVNFDIAKINSSFSPGERTMQDDECKAYIEYVLKNDTAERMESYEWVKSSIERINQYVRMCYYLSFIGPNDVLDILNGNLFVNIKSESITNKRNRKLESILNTIKSEYRDELVETWSSIDKKYSDGILVLIPLKWIIYEYRNIFRYFGCAKYFKNIYSSFTNDYYELENTAHEMCSTVQELFRRNTINVPSIFLKFYSILTDGIVLLLDNLIAINIVECFFKTGSIIIPLIISIGFHLVTVCIIYYMNGVITELSKPIKSSTELEYFDNHIETIFNEMRVLNQEGKMRMRIN